MTKLARASPQTRDQPAEPSSPPVYWRQFLRAKRGVLKCAKRTKPNDNGGSRRGVFRSCFESSHGSSWFRGRLLGKGSYGSVFLAEVIRPFAADDDDDPDSNIPTEIAVKSSFMEDSSSLQFEKKVLDDLKSCPNVVHCYGDEVTRSISGEKIYNILMEYCSGGSLRDRINKYRAKGLTELEVRRYTRDIVYGIVHIHGCKYIHSDIKPENILLSPCTDHGGRLEAKIADLGLAKEMTDVVIIDDEDIRGTGPYMAPELVRDNYSDWPVDIWALGCVVLEMLTGKRVWSSKNSESNLLDRIGNGDELLEIPDGISPMAMDFLRRCLIRNPYKRTPAWLLVGHPFVLFV